MTNKQDTRPYFIGKVELADDGDEWLASVMLMGPLDPPYENVGSSRIISRRFFPLKSKDDAIGWVNGYGSTLDGAAEYERALSSYETERFYIDD